MMKKKINQKTAHQTKKEEEGEEGEAEDEETNSNTLFSDTSDWPALFQII